MGTDGRAAACALVLVMEQGCDPTEAVDRAIVFLGSIADRLAARELLRGRLRLKVTTGMRAALDPGCDGGSGPLHRIGRELAQLIERPTYFEPATWSARSEAQVRDALAEVDEVFNAWVRGEIRINREKAA